MAVQGVVTVVRNDGGRAMRSVDRTGFMYIGRDERVFAALDIG